MKNAFDLFPHPAEVRSSVCSSANLRGTCSGYLRCRRRIGAEANERLVHIFHVSAIAIRHSLIQVHFLPPVKGDGRATLSQFWLISISAFSARLCQVARACKSRGSRMFGSSSHLFLRSTHIIHR